MSLKTFVKVSRVSNLSDARYCAGMMVNMIGFNLDEGDQDFVDAQEFQEITEWVAGVKFVGEFESSDINSIKLKSQDYALDYIEVSNPDYLEEVKELGLPVIFKVKIREAAHIEKLNILLTYVADFSDFIVIECENPLFFTGIDESLKENSNNYPLIKAYNITEETVKHLSDPWTGIQLVGTSEDHPGFKDYGIVMDILEVLEE